MDDDRRKRRMLGSVLPSTSDNIHEDQVEALSKDLREMQPLRELRSLPQWEEAQKVLERQAEITADTIIGLSRDPVKNEKNILRCWAMIAAIQDLIDTVDQNEEEAAEKVEAIEKRLEIMERISRMPGASDVERTL